MWSQIRQGFASGISLAVVIGLTATTFAQKMTMSSTGTVTNAAGNKVAGARVALFGQTGGGLFFQSSGKSNAMGVYPKVALPLYTPVKAGNNVWWGVVGKKITVAGRNVTWEYGVDQGLVAHPGANMDAAIDKDINLNLVGGGMLPAWLAAGQWAWLVNDPTYTFTSTSPYHGTISFSSAFFPGVDDINVMGMAQYRDGSRFTGNDIDETGNILSESIFDTRLEIDDIQVSGLDASGHPILSGGGVRFTTADGAVLVTGALGGLVADSTSGEPRFEGTLSGLQFGGSYASSTLMRQWSEDVLGGYAFRFGFDPHLLTATSGFTHDATISSFVTAATVPEPTPLLLAASGVALMLARRRSGRGK